MGDIADEHESWLGDEMAKDPDWEEFLYGDRLDPLYDENGFPLKKTEISDINDLPKVINPEDF